MRISDWSSDVCSSDLTGDAVFDRQGQLGAAASAAQGVFSGTAAGPAAAYRHRLEVPRDVRIPRCGTGALRRRSEGAHQYAGAGAGHRPRSEEHTSELQSLMRISYAVFCLKKKKVQPSVEQHILRITRTIYTQ